jgi:NAD-dependent dihydropyrimidine dehydrogenase PreA subunit
MERDILKIDEELCNGCGQCVPNCQEGALQIIDGKVRLVSELMCDGLGACIGHCPEGAITIEKREAEAYNEIIVLNHAKKSSKSVNLAPAINHHTDRGGGCPGSRAMVLERAESRSDGTGNSSQSSELRQWPVQLHLINPASPGFRDSELLLAADCVAYTMGGFHNNHLKGRSLAIACPKLDHGIESYIGKLTAMIEISKLKTITVMMVEVPCCRGLLQMVMTAMARARVRVPVKEIVAGINGEILREEWNQDYDI